MASYLRIDDIMRTQSHLLDLELQKGEHQNDNLIGTSRSQLLHLRLHFSQSMLHMPQVTLEFQPVVAQYKFQLQAGACLA